jgi:hypothetical protein
MKSVLIVAVTGALAAAAYGELGELVASFPNVGASTHYGLAADADYLYSFHYWSADGYPVIRMMRSNGSFVSSYRCPLGTTTPNERCRGLSYGGGTFLYINNYYTRVVGRFHASDGSLVSTWTWPTSMSYRFGICNTHDGRSGGNRIYQSYWTGDFWFSTTAGSLISSFRLTVDTLNYDLAWDYGNKLVWYANYGNDWIAAVDPGTQKIVASFRHPEEASISSCYGIAYWGKYLYVSNSGGNPDEYIWVFDCPDGIGVAPASVGRIKALYR